MKQGAPVEAMIRFIEAATDKALLLHERSDAKGADKVMAEAVGLYRAITQSEEAAASARAMLWRSSGPAIRGP